MRTKALFTPEDLQKNQTNDQIVLDVIDTKSSF